MLTTNRRLRTIFIALAGMEAVVAAVALLLLFRFEPIWGSAAPVIAPARLVLGLWVVILALLAAVDMLTRSRLSDRNYRLTTLALMAVTGLFLARELAGASGVFDLRWLVQAVVLAVNFHRGLHPATFGLILGFFLWWRASSLADRDVAFGGSGCLFDWGCCW
ncbi:MAG: hypothetical protein R2856_31150 [Caldilineaceae bacterium]